MMEAARSSFSLTSFCSVRGLTASGQCSKNETSTCGARSRCQRLGIRRLRSREISSRFGEGRPSSIFVGRAASDSSNERLILNLAERRAGRIPAVGVLLDPEQFSTWENFDNALAFNKAAKAFGAETVRLGDILLEKMLGNRDDDGGFQDRPNCLFVPAFGASPAFTSRSDLVLKPHNYIQLVLDPELASADFVAEYLNTSIGSLTLRAVQTGALHKRIALGDVDSAPLPLPPLHDQLRVMTLQHRLNGLRAELEATGRDLWRSKDGVRTASRSLQAFPASDSLDSWLPRLPYPLASILWNYQATLEPLSTNRDSLRVLRGDGRVLDDDSAQRPPIKSDAVRGSEERSVERAEGMRWRDASLGFWIVIGMNLAKTVRRMLAGEQRLLCRDVFRCSGTWLDAMTNKDLFAVLERVAELRNAWKGHGGIESDQESEQRLDRLQAELTTLFGPLTTAFEDLVLIRPKSLQFDGQVYDVVVEELIGHAVPFRGDDSTGIGSHEDTCCLPQARLTAWMAWSCCLSSASA